jgi:hypothetical protein
MNIRMAEYNFRKDRRASQLALCQSHKLAERRKKRKRKKVITAKSLCLLILTD